MAYLGFIIHHSACSSINGKGYDFMVLRDGTIIPAPLPTDPSYIHVCLEGDFSRPQADSAERSGQLFAASKLIQRLSVKLGIPAADLLPHTDSCPGAHLPWSKLVISEQDRYH